MKSLFNLNFIIACFLFLTTGLFAQTKPPENKIIFLDSTWNETNSEDYKYIRIVEDYYSDKKLYSIKDYYKSRVLQMAGTSSSKDAVIEEGQFIYYYENGNKQLTVNYSNGKKTGKQFNWYENGSINSELECFEDKDGIVNFKINNYWNLQKEQKVIAGNGDYEYINKDHFEQSGKVKDGFHDGIWKGKSIDYKYSFTEHYENGKFLSGISIDSLNVEHLYSIINQSPVPKKGIESFYNYIGKSLSIAMAMYSPETRNALSGQRIVITFLVDKDGSLTDPKIIKGVHPKWDINAIKAINNAKKWIPGLQRGIPIKVLYSLPITIIDNPQ